MPTQTVNINDAEDQFADLIAIASEGGEIVIVRDGKPLARLVPANGGAAYKSRPAGANEFGSEEEPLAWDAEGWENVA